MGDFLAELKRRHIYRVAAAYAVVAWVLIQLVGVVMPVFDLPVWVGRATFWFLLAGFPIAMIFAWIHELAPAASGGALGRAATGKLDWVLIGALIAVLALVSYQQFSASPAARTSQQQAGVAAARRAASDPHGAISLAVLPFANLSDDKQQEFFSDGMTDEIGTALAKIPDLRVVARQSAYRFKGGKEDARAIGQALSATHLLEGSVRKAGNRVRISAELVKADDGLRIWAENYDRDLTDVFAIQEDIAHSIAGSLRMPLGIKPGENLVNARTQNPQSHEAYLRARNLVRTRRLESIDEAIGILEDVVAHDPDYAAAWGLLGLAHHFRLFVEPAVIIGSVEKARPIVAEHLAKGRAAAEKAIQLDPKSADGYEALGAMRGDAGDHVGAMEARLQALALDPDHPDALQGYSVSLAHMGFVKQALPIREHLLAVEPYVPAFQGVTARILFADGQTDKALAILQGNIRSIQSIEILAAVGRYRESADRAVTLAKDAVQMQDPAFAAAMNSFLKLMRAAPAPAPKDSPELGALDFVYVYTGAPERLMGAYEKGVQMGFQAGGNNSAEWAPAYAAVRKTERFKQFIRDAGILTYWRAKGWPERCHPTTGDDFACN